MWTEIKNRYLLHFLCSFPQSLIHHIGHPGDKFGIRGFSLGIADGIAEKSLKCVQIAPVPGHFNGMADGTLHTAGGGLKGLGDLGVQYLGDGVGVLSARLGSLLDALFETYN